MNKAKSDPWKLAYEKSIVLMCSWKMTGNHQWSKGFNKGMERAVDIMEHYMPKASAKAKKKGKKNE